MTTTTPEIPDSSTSSAHVNFFARIPMPRLERGSDVEAWFLSLDFWFPASGIVTDQRKFDTVLASIEPSTLTQLTNVISSVPNTNKYEFIKKELIAFFSDSNQRRFNRLLSELQLGDLRPSQLLHEMKRVAGQTISEDAIRSLWAQRLPEHARAAVVASSGSTDEVARIADAIVDALQLNVNSIGATTKTTSPIKNHNSLSLEALQLEINKISKTLDRLTTSRNFSNRSRSRNRNHF